MAQLITVRHGDTLTTILKEKRGLQDHDIHAWQRKMVKLNPHISNLNRIFPGESILIPDALLEAIPKSRIWQNAFSKIPKALTQKPRNFNGKRPKSRPNSPRKNGACLRAGHEINNPLKSHSF